MPGMVLGIWVSHLKNKNSCPYNAYILSAKGFEYSLPINVHVVISCMCLLCCHIVKHVKIGMKKNKIKMEIISEVVCLHPILGGYCSEWCSYTARSSRNILPVPKLKCYHILNRYSFYLDVASKSIYFIKRPFFYFAICRLFPTLFEFVLLHTYLFSKHLLSSYCVCQVTAGKLNKLGFPALKWNRAANQCFWYAVLQKRSTGVCKERYCLVEWRTTFISHEHDLLFA